MSKVRVQVEGLKELDAKLKDFDGKLAKTIVKRALRAGAKVTLTSARALAPQKTGRLRSAIKVMAGKSRKGYVSITVGIGKKWFEGDEFYAAFQEFGWKSGRRGLGDKRKANPGEHYVEGAFDETKHAAVARITEVLREQIEKELRKSGGK